MVRGTVVLPHGLGKAKRVLAIATGEKQKEAEDADADFIGGEEMVEKIQGGWTDFDAVVATPDMMRAVGRLGKVLGPRGLMPNPKTGTVTFEIGKAVREIKAGKVEFRVDKAGVVHAPVGKASFSTQNLVENTKALVESVVRAKPSAGKGEVLEERHADVDDGARYSDRHGRARCSGQAVDRNSDSGLPRSYGVWDRECLGSRLKDDSHVSNPSGEGKRAGAVRGKA